MSNVHLMVIDTNNDFCINYRGRNRCGPTIRLLLESFDDLKEIEIRNSYAGSDLSTTESQEMDLALAIIKDTPDHYYRSAEGDRRVTWYPNVELPAVPVQEKKESELPLGTTTVTVDLSEKELCRLLEKVYKNEGVFKNPVCRILVILPDKESSSEMPIISARIAERPTRPRGGGREA